MLERLAFSLLKFQQNLERDSIHHMFDDVNKHKYEEHKLLVEFAEEVAGQKGDAQQIAQSYLNRQTSDKTTIQAQISEYTAFLEKYRHDPEIEKMWLQTEKDALDRDAKSFEKLIKERPVGSHLMDKP